MAQIIHHKMKTFTIQYALPSGGYVVFSPNNLFSLELICFESARTLAVLLANHGIISNKFRIQDSTGEIVYHS